MNARPPPAQASRTLRAQAAAWISKLHGPERSAALEEDFRSWLGADPRHARAFEQVTDVWNAIGSVHVGGLPRAGAQDAAANARRPVLGLALTACLVLAIAGIAWLRLADRPYATEIGEQHIVTLEDGSRVHLNSATRLGVYMAPGLRRMKLIEGEAFFEVTADPKRPFVVTAGERSVTALGTSFVVRHDAGRTVVTLLEGAVEIQSSASPARVLKPGERATYEKGLADRIDVPQPEATAAWRRGEVILDDTPLRSAIAEMNRYQRQRLVLADPAIGELPISGIYRAGDNADFAHAVAAVYGLQVVHEGSEIRLDKRGF